MKYTGFIDQLHIANTSQDKYCYETQIPLCGRETKHLKTLQNLPPAPLVFVMQKFIVY
jgi:hypothetical protein